MNKLYLPLVALSGIVTGLAVILPEIFGFLQWFSLTPALFVFMKMAEGEEIRLRRFLGLGVLYFFSFFSVCFHWFCYMYPLDFTGLDNFTSVLVIIVAWFGLSLFQALGGGIALLLFGVFAKLGTFRRYPISALFTLPIIYTVFEYSQTFGWWGVPWGRLCLGQMEFLPAVGAASLFGSYFITFIILLVNTAISFALIHGKRQKLKSAAICIASFAFAFNLFIGGLTLGSAEEKFKSSEKITVAAIQGNFSSTDSWQIDIFTTLEAYEKHTRAAAEDGAKVILWPETALSYNLDITSFVGRKIEMISRECDVTIVVGTLAHENGIIYNCLYTVTPTEGFTDTVYKKRHLVPFGEYMPMRDFLDVFLPFLSEINMLSSDMTPGADTAVTYVEGVGNLGYLLCFDSIYEELSRDTALDGAELLLLGTNDSWFGDSAAIYMHNNQARLRSIETGRYTLRAANTGVSTIITPFGEVTAELGALVDGYIVGEVSPSCEQTLYTYTGNLFVNLCTAGLFVYLLVEIFIKIRDRRRNCDGGEADKKLD